MDRRIELSPAVARVVTLVTVSFALDRWPNGEPDRTAMPMYQVGIETRMSGGMALRHSADLAEVRRLAVDLAERLGVPLDDVTGLAGGR